jgi:hypothetical protein
LQDLEEERDHLALYGVDKYFPKSIDRLKELMGSENSTADEEAAAWALEFWEEVREEWNQRRLSTVHNNIT